jgi:hypothetical protein
MSVKIISDRVTESRESGIFSIGPFSYFFKHLPIDLFRRELNGYKFLRHHYPVPDLLFSESQGDSGILIFSSEKSIGNERGLLVDLIASETREAETYSSLLSLFQSTFLRTLRKAQGRSSDVFFRNRIETRLAPLQMSSVIAQMETRSVSLNGLPIDFGGIRILLKDVARFFRRRRTSWCVASQCDPNDLNLGLKPLILDFTAGGMNPLMAEFATFF